MERLYSFLKHAFVPNEHNDHKPHFLRTGIISSFIALVFLTQASAFYQILHQFNASAFLASVLPSVLTDLTNQTRATENLTTLTENPLLVNAARMKAQDMALKGYFAHVTPDGETPWYWLDQAGYKYAYAGENLAVNFSESGDVMNAWMNSPTHRANIEKPNYTQIGIATAEGIYKGRPAVFVVQYFASPALAEAPASTPEPTAPKQVVSKQGSGEVKAAEIKQKTIAAVPVVTPAVIDLRTQIAQQETIPAVPSRSSENSTIVLEFSLALVVFALGLAIILKAHTKHPKLILNALVAILILTSLSLIERQLMSHGVVLPSSNSSASVYLAQ